MTRSSTPPGIPIAPGLDVQKLGPFGWDLAPSESFNGLTTVTLRYTEEEVEGLDESRLTVAFHDENVNQWRQDGVYIAGSNVLTNELVFQADRFGFFTFAEGSRPVPPTPTATPGPLSALSPGAGSLFPLLVLPAAAGGLMLRRVTA
jgi:hypothetical protein